MKKLLITCILLLFLIAGYCQTNTFYASYNSFSGGIRDIKTTLDNRLILFTNDWNSNVHHLVKIDSMGFILWQTKLTSPYPQNSFAVVQTSDSGYVALMASYTGNGMITVVKVDKNGVYLWSNKFNQSSSNQANDITETENGGFAVIGGGCSGNNFVIKFDVNGSILWKNQYRDFSYAGSAGTNIIHNKTDNSLVISGFTGNTPFDYKAILFSVDANGNSLWYKIYPLPRNTIPKGLIKTSDNGYSITGYTLTLDTNVYCPFLMHTDSTGNFLWGKGFYNNNSSYVEDLVQLGDGSYVLTGTYSDPGPLNVQMLNIKTDQNGSIVWAETSGNISTGGTGADELSSSAWISGNYFFTAGFADNTIVVKNDGNSGSGICTFDTVTYSLTNLSPVQVSPSITLLPLTFTSDTILTTPGSPGYVRNILCSTAITEYDPENSLNVFPNPCSGTTTIHTDVQVYNATLSVDNCFGQTAMEITNITGQIFTLDATNLPAGLYYIRLRDQNKIIATNKLIITE